MRHEQSAFAANARVEAVTARAVAHAAEQRVLIGRMMHQHPGHPGIFFFQAARRNTPALAAVVAEQDTPVRMNSLSPPNSRRTSAAAQHHASARHEMPFMRIAV